jgi:hypothetical protein
MYGASTCSRNTRGRVPVTARPNLDIGTLYVLSNRDQSLAKIGLMRDGNPDARATDYERAHGIRWHVYRSAVTCNDSGRTSSACGSWRW